MIRLLLLTLAVTVGLATSAMAQTDPMADLRAGNASFKDGKYDEAVQAYTRAIISGQLGAEALAVTFNNRGVAYGELGDFDRAILDYNEALGLRPDDATSIRNLRVGHVKRGVAEANLGERDKAIADFTKAIELDPSHYLAYMRRGQVQGDAGNLDAAVADLEKAQNLAPDNTQIVELLGKARQAQAGGRERLVRGELADGRPEASASGREWRTPPLWGIGLTATVSGHTQFLHDGRARNLLEAILWHGGEAQGARNRVVDLSKPERDALLAFLGSL